MVVVVSPTCFLLLSAPSISLLLSGVTAVIKMMIVKVAESNGGGKCKTLVFLLAPELVIFQKLL